MCERERERERDGVSERERERERERVFSASYFSLARALSLLLY